MTVHEAALEVVEAEQKYARIMKEPLTVFGNPVLDKNSAAMALVVLTRRRLVLEKLIQQESTTP